MTGESRWFRSPSVLLAFGALVVALAAEIGIGRASGAPSDFVLFLGHFHPLVVHLPIGVFVLVGAAEALSFFPRYRERIDPALGLALPALIVVTVTAFVLGHFLARGGGFAAHALATHRRLELVAVVGTVVSVVAWAYHSAHETPQSRTAFRVALFTTLTVLSVGAHFGGTVTHGDTYLTEFAPGPVKALLGGAPKGTPSAASSAKAPKAPHAEPLLYADVVQPIVAKYCTGCHGAKKSKGKLRLDSVEAMLKGGEDGPAFVAGSSATSELVKRVRLPVDDDDRMPPESKPGPKPEELAVIAFWIDRGASTTLRVRDTLAPETGRKLLESALGKQQHVPASTAKSAPESSASAPASERAAGSASAPPSASAPERAKRTADPEPTSASSAPAEPSAAPEPPSASAPSARGVLADRCQKCHGPSKKKGGLRVDSVEAVLAGGEDGPAVVPGDPERSELVRRIRLPLGQKEHMPPKKEQQLSEAEVAALAAWVRGLTKSSGGSSRTASSGATASVSTATPAGSKAESSDGAPASESKAESAASASGASATPSSEPAAAPKGETPAAKSEPPDGAPGDAALLARLPARLLLYEDAVAPLLAKRCGKCHTGKKPAAQLRIDDYDALLEGGLSGPGIVSGKPDESLVVHRAGLPSTDDDHMPPEDEPSMTTDELALVREWVKRGAGRTLEVPSKDLPEPARRAAAAYSHGPNTTPLHAEAGCAACSVAGAGGSSGALGAALLAVGALFLRRGARKPRARAGVR